MAPCRICDNPSCSLLFYVGVHSLVQCRRCQFVQVAEQPTEEQLRAIYSEGYFTHQKYLDKKTLDRENLRRLKLLKEFVPNQGAAVLDAGCASGDFIHFAKTTYSMSGFDYSPEAVSLARIRVPELAERIWVGGVERVPVPNQFFDAICLWDVIEHIWDPVAACTGLMELLRPGGVLLLSTPKIDSLSARLLRTKWHFMTPPEHLSFLTKNSLVALTHRTNSHLVRRFSRGKWGNIVFLLRKFKRKFGFIVPDICLDLLSKSSLRNLAIYVPTNDIQYVVLKKAEE